MMAATSFVPYRERAPDTADLRALKAEHERWREEFGRRSSEAAESWARWCREAARQGQLLDGLRRYTANEAERFFAQTIPGPDGHTYWDGAKGGFVTNEKRCRVPRLWWWERANGVTLPMGDTVEATCGERNCITPEHCRFVDRREKRLRYTDEQMVGRLQVVAMRLGHSPTEPEWRQLAGRPSDSVYCTRFGSWQNALRAAGLAFEVRWHATPEKCLAALRLVAGILGRPHFQQKEFSACREQLQAAGLPFSRHAISDHLGAWSEALKRASQP